MCVNAKHIGECEATATNDHKCEGTTIVEAYADAEPPTCLLLRLIFRNIHAVHVSSYISMRAAHAVNKIGYTHTADVKSFLLIRPLR